MFRTAFVALLFVLPGFAASAQPPKGDDKRDPQAKFEPKSKPGEGQKFLARFVGDWDVEKTFYPRTGDPAKSKGTCRQTLTQEGRFLESDFTFETEAGKTTGKGTIGFEPETGTFTSVWIDSRQTRMSFRQSDEKFDGKKIVLVGKALGEGAKDGRKSRTTSTIEDDGSKIVHRQAAIDTDGKERLVMELVLTKKPAK